MQLTFSFQSMAFIALLFLGIAVGPASAEEGKAGIFVFDPGSETASPFRKNGPVPANSELRVFATGPKGSTVIVGAFSENGLHDGLLPVAVEQTNGTETVRFPASSDSAKWTVKPGQKSAELYAVVFPGSNPALEPIAAEVKQIEAAQQRGEADLVMLLALELKKKLANAIRESGAKEYREGFSDSLADLLKEEPTAKAAVTRTGTGLEEDSKLTNEAKPEPKSLEELEKSWRDDSTAIPIGLVAPGGFVRTITPTP